LVVAEAVIAQVLFSGLLLLMMPPNPQLQQLLWQTFFSGTVKFLFIAGPPACGQTDATVAHFLDMVLLLGLWTR